jgi:hypothetical protein
MRWLDKIATLEISNSSRYLQDACVSTSAESEAIHRHLQQPFTGRINFAPCLQLPGSHLRVAIKGGPSETGKLQVTRTIDALANR